jgi:hypothetical protein
VSAHSNSHADRSKIQRSFRVWGGSTGEGNQRASALNDIMKQIRVLVSHVVHVSTTGTNLTTATSLGEEARRNKAKVLNGALTIEKEVTRLLSHYFFGRSHERKTVFEALVLNSDWCSFAAKRKLIKHVIEEQHLLDGQAKNECDELLRRVMSIRNAFTHGTLASDDKTVKLSYFEGMPREQELTDEFLSDVETTMFKAYNCAQALAQKMGI